MPRSRLRSSNRTAAHPATPEQVLDAVLEHLATAAFVLDQTGEVQHANTMGRLLDTEAERSRLRTLLRGEATDDTYSITRIEVAGCGTYHLAVRAASPADNGEVHVRAAAKQWALTARQAQVLGLLVRGRANKEIAEALRCSPRTVEVHVSAILRKAMVDSRTNLLAALWNLGAG